MYKDFYGLTKYPFLMTPDPKNLFLTAQHREAVAGLAYAILNRKGLLVLSGEVGTGKTTVLARVLSFLPPERVCAIIVRYPTLQPDEFIEMVMLGFGITGFPESKAQRLIILEKHLLRLHAQGKIAALIIDEAQKLSRDLMEEVRLLGNLDHGDQNLLQIVMAGQSELDDLLRRDNLRQLKQRVAVRLSLDPLTTPEVEHYIRYRWTQAGGKPEHPFTEQAIAAVARWSRGIPRLINAICDNALLLAFAEPKPLVEVSEVQEAAADLDLVAPQSAKLAVNGVVNGAGNVAGNGAVNGAVNGAGVKPSGVQHELLATPLTSKIPEIRVPQFYGATTKPSLWDRCAAKLGLA